MADAFATPSAPVPASEALRRLREGNERFVRNVRSVEAMISQSRRAELVAGQSPIAIVLACSDARAPVQLVFDCGIGDLFVVRVAGNIVAPSIVGSIEFAATMFGTALVVVMGHTNCGAVTATLAAIGGGRAPPSPNIRDIVERIAPAVVEVARAIDDPAERLRAAVRANIRASVGHLRHGSRVLEERVRAGGLCVVGAEYSLETGAVEFLEDLD